MNKNKFKQFYGSDLQKSNKLSRQYKLLHFFFSVILLTTIIIFVDNLNAAKIIIVLTVLANFSLQVKSEKEKEEIKKTARVLYRLNFDEKGDKSG